MKSALFMLLLILLFPANAVYGSDDDIWIKANSAYDQNNFDSAIEGYRLLLEHGIRQPEVYYNLGSAYFKNDQLGMAIAAFRHCLKINPSFKLAQENLDYVRKFTIDKVEKRDRGFMLDIWYGLAEILPPEGHFIFTIAVFWVLCLIITLLLLGFGKKELLIYLLILLTVVFIFEVVITNFVIDETINTRWGVITVVSAELREGPGEDFGKIFTGHEGLEFKILSWRQGYYLVELANGLKGWIQEITLTEI